jgi:hypothetical protein
MCESPLSGFEQMHLRTASVSGYNLSAMNVPALLATERGHQFHEIPL